MVRTLLPNISYYHYNKRGKETSHGHCTLLIEVKVYELYMVMREDLGELGSYFPLWCVLWLNRMIKKVKNRS